jgi:hypothetical protein
MIHKTACVSFPRSGHHALKNVLCEYFGPGFGYCDNYLDPPERRLENCEETVFQKEHDLGLSIPILPYRHLIQIRDPIHSIQSWIDFDSTVGAANANPSREEWAAVFKTRTALWCEWFSKWVLSPIWPRLVVPYQSLITRPYETCANVILFMTGEHEDARRLADALAKFPIVPQTTRGIKWVDII